ncbi:sodium ABC transporter ATP-binding protein [Paenibacillus swuensis]|uniref:Sodium ABC transporter ATP-binding protein n=1 Tax=Paenibacillus swuensis TaxID=1178515 RepID=A0A172TER3_9BACL|nr:ABC transporter ATP-binding protein [Paenibacillus swuensis]ANE45539.1 sodium ABC transporter ATP-binding protein [Paenibacillus swuensis]
MSALQLTNVSKQYADKTAVNNISLEVQPGEIYGLLGANGAGKTTTMRMVLGLIYPDSGEIRLKGQKQTLANSRRIGYLPEERGLYPKVKVSEQILYLAQLRGVSRKQADTDLKRWLEKFEVPEYYDKKVEELSKGNQQKIQFIAAVIHNPEIMVLDEAFSGLDPVNVELLKETVKELRDNGASILFSTHRMEHVEELCRNITILHKSNTVLKGSVKDIKRSFPKEKVVLGVEHELRGLESVAGVTGVKRTESGYVLGIDRPEAAQDVLAAAMSQGPLQKFEVPELTLNEIFIRSVGERHA